MPPKKCKYTTFVWKITYLKSPENKAVRHKYNFGGIGSCGYIWVSGNAMATVRKSTSEE